MFGYSWCVTSVFGSQVFGQASMESSVVVILLLRILQLETDNMLGYI